MGKAVAGERAAVAAIWTRYAQMSRYLIQATVGFQENVDDLLQDVFVAFLSSAARIRNRDALRAYLLATAVLIARREIRRRGWRRVVALSTTGKLPDVPAPAVDFDGREMLRALEVALGRMPARVRAGYHLHHVCGLDLEDVARKIGVSRSTAKRAVARARRRLRTLSARQPCLLRFGSVRP